jgi:hypothetical protein
LKSILGEDGQIPHLPSLKDYENRQTNKDENEEWVDDVYVKRSLASEYSNKGLTRYHNHGNCAEQEKQNKKDERSVSQEASFDFDHRVVAHFFHRSPTVLTSISIYISNPPNVQRRKQRSMQLQRVRTEDGGQEAVSL